MSLLLESQPFLRALLHRGSKCTTPCQGVHVTGRCASFSSRCEGGPADRLGHLPLLTTQTLPQTTRYMYLPPSPTSCLPPPLPSLLLSHNILPPPLTQHPPSPSHTTPPSPSHTTSFLPLSHNTSLPLSHNILPPPLTQHPPSPSHTTPSHNVCTPSLPLTHHPPSPSHTTPSLLTQHPPSPSHTTPSLPLSHNTLPHTTPSLPLSHNALPPPLTQCPPSLSHNALPPSSHNTLPPSSLPLTQRPYRWLAGLCNGRREQFGGEPV